MAVEKPPTLLQEVSKGAIWGGIIAGLRIASLNLFSLATANFLALFAMGGAAVTGTIHLLREFLGPSKTQTAS